MMGLNESVVNVTRTGFHMYIDLNAIHSLCASIVEYTPMGQYWSSCKLEEES